MACGTLERIRDGPFEGVLQCRGQMSIAGIAGTDIFLETLRLAVRDAHVGRIRDLPFGTGC